MTRVKLVAINELRHKKGDAKCRKGPHAQSDQSLRCPLTESVYTVEKWISKEGPNQKARMRSLIIPCYTIFGPRQAKRVFGHMRTPTAQISVSIPLRKDAHSNILNVLPPKNESFHIKKF